MAGDFFNDIKTTANHRATFIKSLCCHYIKIIKNKK